MTAFRIVDGRDISPLLWWPEGSVGTRARRAPPRMMVWHWTGGVRGVEGVVQTLRRRKLSVHFVLETSGRVVQLADVATTVTFHAGKANSPSIGCEIVGGPWGDFTTEQYASIAVLAEAMGAHVPRVVFDARVHELVTFSGHCEHRDVSPGRKIDAGGRVSSFLRARWGLS